jgi:hypothetical protein
MERKSRLTVVSLNAILAVYCPAAQTSDPKRGHESQLWEWTTAAMGER